MATSIRGERMAINRAPGRARIAPWAVVVGVIAVAGLWIAPGSSAAEIRVVEGWAMPNQTGGAISLHEAPRSTGTNPGEGYVVAGAAWRRGGAWHDGADLPTCVGTDTGAFTRVRMGVVEVRPQDAPARAHVVWLECLD